MSETSCEDFNSRSFGVNFIDPVDQYLKSDRAIKYALLFIALTFAGFFLFEVLKSLTVHPIHTPWWVWRWRSSTCAAVVVRAPRLCLGLSVSASACVVLIGFYVSHVLRSVRHGLSFSGVGGVVWLVVRLLSAEDYALLMGSLLLFGLLGVVMVLTRNWIGMGWSGKETSHWSLISERCTE